MKANLLRTHKCPSVALDPVSFPNLFKFIKYVCACILEFFNAIVRILQMRTMKPGRKAGGRKWWSCCPRSPDFSLVLFAENMPLETVNSG